MKNLLLKPTLVLSAGLLALTTAVPLALADTTASHVTLVQQRGDTDITTRINALNGIVSKINNSKKLTAAQKDELLTEIQNQVTALTSLKSTLDADTDLTTARADFQKIFTEHYIFAFYAPRIDRIVAADAELDAADLLLSIAPKLQGYLDEAKNQGSDITALQASLTEMENKATDAQTLANQVLTTLLPLTAAGYPGNKSTVQGAATTLKTARTDLQTSRTDAKTVIDGLKKLIPTTTIQ